MSLTSSISGFQLLPARPAASPPARSPSAPPRAHAPRPSPTPLKLRRLRNSLSTLARAGKWDDMFRLAFADPGACAALPVHDALELGRLDMAERMVDAGIGLHEYRDQAGRTLLHRASSGVWVTWLLDRAPDLLEAHDDAGERPLQFGVKRLSMETDAARARGVSEAVVAMIQAGADLETCSGAPGAVPAQVMIDKLLQGPRVNPRLEAFAGAWQSWKAYRAAQAALAEFRFEAPQPA